MKGLRPGRLAAVKRLQMGGLDVVLIYILYYRQYPHFGEQGKPEEYNYLYTV